MASQISTGRPPAKILTDYFKPLEKLDNKSNRRFYECKYCGPNGAGKWIEGRDNKPLKHILVCPEATQAARNAVCTYLASKTQELQPSILGAIDLEPGTSTASDDIERIDEPTKVLAKRPSGTLAGFVDPLLSKTQQECANVKLFR